MEISLFATIIAIIAGLLTIVQIIKEFSNPNSNAKIQQNNSHGNNYYLDNSTHIKNTTKTTINNSNSSNSNDTIAFEVIIGFIIFAIMLILYSIIYKLIPIICLLLLSISIYRDTKVPFENSNVKIQWALKKIYFLIVIIILLFIPKSVLNTLEQIPGFGYESFAKVLESVTLNIKFIINLYNESTLLGFTLVGRILITFGLLLHLFISTIARIRIHKSQKPIDLVIFSICAILMILGLNIEYFWNLAEPFRHNVEIWFDPSL
ncbi:hypothetical protein [Cytobacillus sp.]|uniref:hypothetical protein n=1 Tax=Cytobacillus sp. TaxID=2675269 RepID=UPI0028BEA60D|nr:hypothetical protein [Cytobacillus sp.]